jgi:CheY-like chemotaxis protein
MDFHVNAVNSGMAAVDEVMRVEQQGGRYDVVLMDWRMPDIDGLCAARMIRERSTESISPIVIMVTAYEREVMIANTDGSDAVYADLLIKPVTPIQLMEAIQRCVLGLSHNANVASQPPESAMALNGIRVLVVEDNELNRQVAEELLTGDGALVELAKGGLEGVEKVSRNRYDLIIMDVQMPDIDGYEATRRIRLDGRFAALPILAMTANALDSDIKACYDAGMNGHVSKPIDMDVLVEKILKLLNRPVPRAMSYAKEKSTMAPGLIDDSQVILKRFGGNKNLFSRMVTNFRPEVMRLFSALELGLVNQQQADVTAALHSLKGMAATMGAKALANLAAELEQQIKHADGHQLHAILQPSILAELNQYFETSEVLLLNLLVEPPLIAVADDKIIDQVESVLTTATVNDLIVELLVLLETDNMAAIGLMETLAGQISPSPTLRLLMEQVNALDFPQAIVSLKTLRDERF